MNPREVSGVHQMKGNVRLILISIDVIYVKFVMVHLVTSYAVHMPIKAIYWSICSSSPALSLSRLILYFQTNEKIDIEVSFVKLHIIP